MKAEKIFNENAKKGMLLWSLDNFKETHQHLYKVVIESINQALKIEPVKITSTFLFSGWYDGEKFEIPIDAIDSESATTVFEVVFPNHKWHMTQKVTLTEI
tara:strand:- start:1123 stop:1425 length:303 start_codon:yes stop_codon:yes gene_type:complete